MTQKELALEMLRHWHAQLEELLYMANGDGSIDHETWSLIKLLVSSMGSAFIYLDSDF